MLTIYYKECIKKKIKIERPFLLQMDWNVVHH